MLEFTVAKSELDGALKYLLHNRTKDDGKLIDLKAQGDTLTFVVTGREIAVAIQSQHDGIARVPAETLKRVRSHLSTQPDPLRIRLQPGEMRVANTIIRHDQITLRDRLRSIDGVPAGASAFDLVTLRDLYSYEELQDSDLHDKVHAAEKKMQENVQQAADLLAAYGVPIPETFALIDRKRTENAILLRKVLATAE